MQIIKCRIAADTPEAKWKKVAEKMARAEVRKAGCSWLKTEVLAFCPEGWAYHKEAQSRCLYLIG